LVAENTIDEAEAPAEEEQHQAPAPEQQDPFDRAADYFRQARGGSFGAGAAEPDTEQQTSDWLARRDHHAAAISTLSQPELTGYEQPSEPETEYEHEPEAEAESASEEPEAPSGASWWQRLRASAKAAEPAADDVSEDFTANSFEPAGSFGQPGEPERAPFLESAEADVQADSPSETEWSEFAAKSWGDASPAASETSEPEPDLQEAEAKIRETLRSALEHSDEAPAPAPAFLKTEDDGAGAASSWRSRWDLGASDDNADETPAAGAFRSAHSDRFPFASPFGADANADEEEEDAPFKLTGKHAKFPVYGSRDDDEAGAAGQDEEAGLHNHPFENDIEDAFRSAGVPKRPAKAASDQLGDQEPLEDFGSLFDERFVRAGEEGSLGDGFEEDAAALQARLESTDLAAYERTRSYGGLAVAAAWAVFFSIVSGIALAFVSFRHDIMAALPGTRSLYQNLGFQVADNAVDFSDVSYRWTTVEGKPMIEVTGQVINVTERTVKVPRVLINVRDGARRDPVKATASVQAELLAPRESTNFTLEFVSPSKDVSQIELEFDHSQTSR
jgi:hypothetical protein